MIHSACDCDYKKRLKHCDKAYNRCKQWAAADKKRAATNRLAQPVVMPARREGPPERGIATLRMVER